MKNKIIFVIVLIAFVLHYEVDSVQNSPPSPLPDEKNKHKYEGKKNGEDDDFAAFSKEEIEKWANISQDLRAETLTMKGLDNEFSEMINAIYNQNKNLDEADLADYEEIMQKLKALLRNAQEYEKEFEKASERNENKLRKESAQKLQKKENDENENINEEKSSARILQLMLKCESILNFNENMKSSKETVEIILGWLHPSDNKWNWNWDSQLWLDYNVSIAHILGHQGRAKPEITNLVNESNALHAKLKRIIFQIEHILDGPCKRVNAKGEMLIFGDMLSEGIDALMQEKTTQKIDGEQSEDKEAMNGNEPIDQKEEPIKIEGKSAKELRKEKINKILDKIRQKSPSRQDIGKKSSSNPLYGQINVLSTNLEEKLEEIREILKKAMEEKNEWERAQINDEGKEELGKYLKVIGEFADGISILPTKFNQSQMLPLVGSSFPLMSSASLKRKEKQNENEGKAKRMIVCRMVDQFFTELVSTAFSESAQTLLGKYTEARKNYVKHRAKKHGKRADKIDMGIFDEEILKTDEEEKIMPPFVLQKIHQLTLELVPISSNLISLFSLLSLQICGSEIFAKRLLTAKEFGKALESKLGTAFQTMLRSLTHPSISTQTETLMTTNERQQQIGTNNPQQSIPILKLILNRWKLPSNGWYGFYSDSLTSLAIVNSSNESSLDAASSSSLTLPRTVSINIRQRILHTLQGINDELQKQIEQFPHPIYVYTTTVEKQNGKNIISEQDELKEKREIEELMVEMENVLLQKNEANFAADEWILESNIIIRMAEECKHIETGMEWLANVSWISDRLLRIPSNSGWNDEKQLERHQMDRMGEEEAKTMRNIRSVLPKLKQFEFQYYMLAEQFCKGIHWTADRILEKRMTKINEDSQIVKGNALLSGSLDIIHLAKNAHKNHLEFTKIMNDIETFLKNSDFQAKMSSELISVMQIFIIKCVQINEHFSGYNGSNYPISSIEWLAANANSHLLDAYSKKIIVSRLEPFIEWATRIHHFNDLAKEFRQLKQQMRQNVNNRLVIDSGKLLNRLWQCASSLVANMKMLKKAFGDE